MDESEMSDMIKNIGKMINDGNIPDDIKNIVNNLKSDSSTNNTDNSSTSSSSTPNIDFDTILKMKSIFEKMNSNEDPRANLLRSLKPYLKESRKSKVDQYIQLFNMTKVMDIFKQNGGENVKWCHLFFPFLDSLCIIIHIEILIIIIFTIIRLIRQFHLFRLVTVIIIMMIEFLKIMVRSLVFLIILSHRGLLWIMQVPLLNSFLIFSESIYILTIF